MSKLFSPRPAHLLKRGPLVILAVLFAVVLALGAFSFAPAAHATVNPGSCNNYTKSRPGALASYNICVTPGRIAIEGSVKDTLKDGYCAMLKVQWENNVTKKVWYTRSEACGVGKITHYNWDYAAGRVELSLLLV